MILHHLAQTFLEVLRIEHLAQADPATRHLVLVARAYTAPCGADRLVAACGLACLVERDVIRQDDRAGLADPHADTRVDAAGLEHLQLFEQGAR